MLKQFYQGSSEGADAGFDPYDINGSDFNPDLYLNKVLVRWLIYSFVLS